MNKTDNPLVIKNVTDSMSFTANFSLKKCTLNVVCNNDAYGTIKKPSSSPIHLNYGTSTDIMAESKVLCEFNNWTKIGNVIINDYNDSSTTITITGNATITANFGFIGAFKTIGGDYSEGRTILKDGDGYAICGKNSGGYVVKINSACEIIIEGTFKFNNELTYFRDMVMDENKNFACAGYCEDIKKASKAVCIIVNNNLSLKVSEYSYPKIGDPLGSGTIANGISKKGSYGFFLSGDWGILGGGSKGPGYFDVGNMTPTTVLSMNSSNSVCTYGVGGNYYTVLAGQNESNATVVNLLDSTVQWQYTTTGGSYNSLHNYYKIRRLSDGSYIVVGIKGSDLLLTKLTSNGVHSWSKTFPNSGSLCGNDVQQTNDGGYIITGYYSLDPASYDNADVVLLKTNSSGTEQWQKIYDWNGLTDIGYSVLQTLENDGYIIVGRASIGTSGYKIFLIRTDVNGNVITSK